MTACIQLAKPFTPKKLTGQVYVSEKLDGVPVRISIMKREVPAMYVSSRQGEDVPSVQFLAAKLYKQVSAHMLAIDTVPNGTVFEFVGEITHETYTDFKDVSGVVRTQSPQTGLILNLFDFFDSRDPKATFKYRHFVLHTFIQPTNEVRVINQIVCSDVDTAMAHSDAYMQAYPKAEGMVFRDPDDLWAPGKRTWGYQKYVKDPTIELRLYGVEQAMSEDGKPLGMVGRLNFWYKGKKIGVGPGKLTHEERTALWQDMQHTAYVFDGGPIATIKYKADPSYKSLRQPTFQHWRHDKDTADA